VWLIFGDYKFDVVEEMVEVVAEQLGVLAIN
jgi:hypothetical protein